MSSVANQPLGPIMTAVGGTTLSVEEKERLLSPAIGGVVLFAKNCEDMRQIQALTEEIRALRSPALLIAVDQEGGRVQRIRQGVAMLPAAAQYGELFDLFPDKGLDAAELGGQLMATEVRGAGIDISFAPVLDIMSQHSEVIGDRAFHSDPDSVAVIAEAWIRGMHIAGMRSVGKHFPGHGGVSADSHFETPEDLRDIRQVMAIDLVPYRRISDRIDAVMTAHVAYPNITGAIPTYSPFWLEHVLREVLAFYGPVFSDDLTMKGAEGAGDPGARVLTALSSGCDIALICQDEAQTDQAIEEMMSNRDAWSDKTWQIDKLRPEPADDSSDAERCRESLSDLLCEIGKSI